MERLKAFSVEKFTLDGRKFHTLIILCTKHLLRLLLTQLGLYSLYAWPLVAVTELNSKQKNLKNLSLLYQRRFYNSISDPNANVILDSASQDSAVFHCSSMPRQDCVHKCLCLFCITQCSRSANEWAHCRYVCHLMRPCLKPIHLTDVVYRPRLAVQLAVAISAACI